MSQGQTSAITPDRNMAGITYVVLGILAFSVQDVIVKFLSGDYAIHQIVLIRSFVAAPVVAMLAYYGGGLKTLIGRQFGVLMFRSVLLYLAYTFYYLSIAAVPIADALAIAFMSPLIITALSSFALGAKVGLERWLAILGEIHSQRRNPGRFGSGWGAHSDRAWHYRGPAIAVA
jgi:drug/metabolite transporter (DMT)-like permease